MSVDRATDIKNEQARQDVLNLAAIIASSPHARMLKYTPLSGNGGLKNKRPATLEDFQKCVKMSTWRPFPEYAETNKWGGIAAKDVWSKLDHAEVRAVNCDQVDGVSISFYLLSTPYSA
jgi:hypothetical protein